MEDIFKNVLIYKHKPRKQNNMVSYPHLIHERINSAASAPVTEKKFLVVFLESTGQFAKDYGHTSVLLPLVKPSYMYINGAYSLSKRCRLLRISCENHIKEWNVINTVRKGIYFPSFWQSF